MLSMGIPAQNSSLFICDSSVRRFVAYLSNQIIYEVEDIPILPLTRGTNLRARVQIIA